MCVYIHTHAICTCIYTQIYTRYTYVYICIYLYIIYVNTNTHTHTQYAFVYVHNTHLRMYRYIHIYMTYITSFSLIFFPQPLPPHKTEQISQRWSWRPIPLCVAVTRRLPVLPWYGVATISRLLKNIVLFCKRAP